MKILSKRHIIVLHSMLIAEYGGIAGIRNEGLLDSAANAPFQRFGGIDIYPPIEQKAARLAFCLMKIMLLLTAISASALMQCLCFWC